MSSGGARAALMAVTRKDVWIAVQEWPGQFFTAIKVQRYLYNLLPGAGAARDAISMSRLAYETFIWTPPLQFVPDSLAFPQVTCCKFPIVVA